MEKKEVLRLFLEKGYQIDVESLNFFAKNDSFLQKFLLEMEEKKFPSTITKEFVDSVLQSDIEIFALQPDKKTLTVDETAKILLEKFNIIKQILVTHMDLVNLLSINKINEKTKRFSLIGVVADIDDDAKRISIFDDTGEITLKVDKKFLDDVLINDILGFSCEKNEGFDVKKIIFPDIPLRRNIKNLTEEKNAIFAEKTTKNILEWCSNQKNQNYLFTFMHAENQAEVPQNTKLIFVGEGPTFATILKNISIFLFDGNFLHRVIKDKKLEDFLISLFKKRYFNATKGFNKILVNNAFVLENIPDIIAINGLKEALQTNYKGTTILTTTENTSWVINLKTREIIKLNST